MMFEPPEQNEDANTQRRYGNHTTDFQNYNSFPGTSPLLRSSPKLQNMNPSLLGPQNLNASIYNRIGKKNHQNLKNRLAINNDKKFNNRRPIRKRRNEGNSGRYNSKNRRWDNNSVSNGNNNTKVNASFPQNIAQERMDRIRRRDSNLGGVQLTFTNDLNQGANRNSVEESKDLIFNDFQDMDNISDITVQVNNNEFVPQQRDGALERFKMVLSPSIRSSINKLQTATKRDRSIKRDSFVITSLPFKPHCTALTLHQRFGLL